MKGLCSKPNGYWHSGRDFKLFKRYGIREEEYQALFEKQGGVCAVCGLPETKKQRRSRFSKTTTDRLHVDHDHTTGKVRGLVCFKCNCGIIKQLDDRDLARKAAQYLGITIDYREPVSFAEVREAV